MKKILLVIDNLGSGGAQNQLSLLALGLKREGYNVSVFTYFKEDFFSNRLKGEDIPIVHVSKKGKLGFNVFQGLSKIIRKSSFEVVISFLDTPNLYAALACLYKSNSTKLIISYRSKTSFTEMNILSRLTKKIVNRKADVIISNSQHEKSTWIEKYPTLASKWTVIYNAVNSQSFYPIQNDLRQKHYLVVGSVGPWKNGLVIIEALALLKAKGLNLYIKWVGKKNRSIKNRNDYINKMQSKIDQYDLNDQWTWLPPTKTINKEYQKCKALILASKTEGLPNVVCEALSCGTPCIVSNVLDHPLLVKNHISGLLFDPDDPKSLENSLTTMENITLQDYNQMSLKAKSNSEKLFSEKKYINNFIQIIEDLF